jgi:hypothetical protein
VSLSAGRVILFILPVYRSCVLLANDSAEREPPMLRALSSPSTADIAERSSGTFKPYSGGSTVRLERYPDRSHALINLVLLRHDPSLLYPLYPFSECVASPLSWTGVPHAVRLMTRLGGALNLPGRPAHCKRGIAPCRNRTYNPVIKSHLWRFCDLSRLVG